MKLATYKYSGVNTPRFISSGIASSAWRIPLMFLIVGVIAYLCATHWSPIAAIFVSIFVLIALASLFAANGPALIIASRYFVFGKKTILYKNIVSISIDEAKWLMLLTRRNGGQITLLAEKFQSNANKEWKIKKNKQEKFIKVVTKILDRGLAENDQLVLKVINGDYFSKYDSTVKA